MRGEGRRRRTNNVGETLFVMRNASGWGGCEREGWREPRVSSAPVEREAAHSLSKALLSSEIPFRRFARCGFVDSDVGAQTQLAWRQPRQPSASHGMGARRHRPGIHRKGRYLGRDVAASRSKVGRCETEGIAEGSCVTARARRQAILTYHRSRAARRRCASPPGTGAPWRLAMALVDGGWRRERGWGSWGGGRRIRVHHHCGRVQGIRVSDRAVGVSIVSGLPCVAGAQVAVTAR